MLIRFVFQQTFTLIVEARDKDDGEAQCSGM